MTQNIYNKKQNDSHKSYLIITLKKNKTFQSKDRYWKNEFKM